MTTFRRLLRRFTHTADTVRLHPHEHAEGRQRLIELMARTPPGTAAAGLSFEPVRFSPWSARWFRPALATACLVALVGVSTVTAAEQALPGDPLYDLKINVTEELRGWLAVTPEAKARLALARSQRRLEEAARLAAAQRLDARARGLVEVRLAVQSRQTRDELARLQAHGQAEAAARLGSRYEAVLKANEQLQQSIAATVRAHGEGERTLLRPVIDQLRQERAAAAQARGDAEALVADASREQARQAAERERRAANAALAAAQVRLQRCRSHAASIAAARMTAQLNQAQQTLDDGEETYGLGAYGAAFARFQAAERTATGASLLMDAHEQLPVQVPLRLGEQGKASESEERLSEGTRQREDAGPTPTEAVKPGLRPPDAGLDRDRGPRRPRGGGGEIRGQEGL